MDRPPPCQVGRPRPQRAVARGREPERRFEGAGKVRLIGKSHLTRHVDEWALLMDPVPREGEPTHEQVTMGARTQHDPELAGEVVASQPGDRLELRRMHDAGSLRIEEAAGAPAPREGAPRGSPPPPPPPPPPPRSPAPP